MASGPITSWEIDGETVETVSDFIFWGALKSLQMVIAAMKLKDTPWKESYDQPRQHIKKQQLEMNMEQQTGSKLGKEYVRTIYCHLACLTYIQITSVKCQDG